MYMAIPLHHLLLPRIFGAHDRSLGAENRVVRADASELARVAAKASTAVDTVAVFVRYNL